MRHGKVEPIYAGPMDPLFPCRIMPTRHCPAVYEETCETRQRPCARYESEDEGPWLVEIGGDFQ